MLTLEGLEAAVKQGYIYAWTFKDGIDFHAQSRNAAIKSTKGKMAQIVTIMNMHTNQKMLKL
jgi:hypothetical protein